MVRQLHLPRGSALVCIIRRLKTVSSSEFDPLHCWTFTELGFVELHYGFELRTVDTPFKKAGHGILSRSRDKRCSDRPA